MEIEFEDGSLERLESDLSYDGGFPPAVVKSFRMKMNFIRQATDERDLRNWKSLRFEKLKGSRIHQHSIRLNVQWRLVVEMLKGKTSTKVRIVSVEDYHRG